MFPYFSLKHERVKDRNQPCNPVCKINIRLIQCDGLKIKCVLCAIKTKTYVIFNTNSVAAKLEYAEHAGNEQTRQPESSGLNYDKYINIALGFCSDRQLVADKNCLYKRYPSHFLYCSSGNIHFLFEMPYSSFALGDRLLTTSQIHIPPLFLDLREFFVQCIKDIFMAAAIVRPQKRRKFDPGKRIRKNIKITQGLNNGTAKWLLHILISVADPLKKKKPPGWRLIAWLLLEVVRQVQ